MTKWTNNGKIEKLIDSNLPLEKDFTLGKLPKKSKIDSLVARYSKELIYDLYIIKNLSYNEVFEKLNIQRNDLRLLLTRYKIKKSRKLSRKNNHYVRSKEKIEEVARKSSETQKRNWSNKPQEVKDEKSIQMRNIQLNLSKEKKKAKADKYREWWKSLSQKEKDDINNRRVKKLKKWRNDNPDWCKKRNEKAKQNRKLRKNQLCRSNMEQQLYNTLIEHYDDVQYDVRVDDRYPYFCDFYIESLDLFIELQAHPSHGRLPIEYLDVDEYSQYSQTWLDVLNRRDVEKNNIAKQNNLNYIRIYPNATLNENIIINNIKYKDIVELCYKSQK